MSIASAMRHYESVSMNVKCRLFFQVSPVTMKSLSAERMSKQPVSVEEGGKKREGLER